MVYICNIPIYIGIYWHIIYSEHFMEKLEQMFWPNQYILCICTRGCVCLVTQSCPTLWDSMVCSLPGSSVHGIFQARILEWVAISFSKGSSWPRDWTQVSRIAGRRFTLWATLNVNGLNAPTKRQRLAEWIQKQDPSICCLQETHLKTRRIQTESEGLEKDIPCK